MARPLNRSPDPDPHPGRQRDPDLIRRLMPLWGWFYRSYFRVQTSGWEHVPASGQLMFVGSHNGGLATPDLPMFLYDWFRRYGLERRVYGLAHAKVWQAYPFAADLAARVGAIPFYPRQALAVLRQGDSLLVYPGGGQDAFRPHRLRGRIHFGGRTGFLRLAIWHGLPLVPLISWGSHDSLYVIEDCYPAARRLHDHGMPWLLGLDPEVMPLYLGLPWGLAVGPLPNLPLPTVIHTRVCQPIHLPRSGHAASRDRAYVQACYDRVVGCMQTELDQLRAEVTGGRRGAWFKP
ncbi:MULTISPECIES: lysophospholipid acyltransferase family protein [unclassified Synechococcus]|uniref:lysophospholipid acyltransferase family protein n=1 Tax=unclassified Synechococcus TaxID=2626047 RepID=UPI001E6006F1|nr:MULTISPECIES: lysophospholipid acyltransferase family protein [unclassified Synechococcus]MEA5421674.1 lysophospholipid acyltransferase family protein [Synechococcus sp. CCY9202]